MLQKNVVEESTFCLVTLAFHLPSDSVLDLVPLRLKQIYGTLQLHVPHSSFEYGGLLQFHRLVPWDGSILAARLGSSPSINRVSCLLQKHSDFHVFSLFYSYQNTIYFVLFFFNIFNIKGSLTFESLLVSFDHRFYLGISCYILGDLCNTLWITPYRQ